MDDYKSLIKERLSKLPNGLQSFIKSENWRKSVEQAGLQNNFTDEQKTSLENEVFLALLCFSETSRLSENIKKECSVGDEVAQKIGDLLNASVFNPVMVDIKNVWNSISLAGAKASPEIKKDTVGDSFEQNIINQARAMQPAKLASQVQAGKPANSPEHHTEPPPLNLPTKDPYREALE